jgi:hypothetical protein
MVQERRNIESVTKIQAQNEENSDVEREKISDPTSPFVATKFSREIEPNPRHPELVSGSMA